jgi:hypothetical protein
MANPTVNPNDASFSSAILTLLKGLAGAISPGLAQRPATINQAVEGNMPAQGVPPQAMPPQQVAPRAALGNQSPGLGSSF